MGKDESGTIKQGSIAEFMRKRTQLVGFDFGLNKHTQYAIEFVDNALDAIESFQWKAQKANPDLAFLLKDDALLENFRYMAGGVSIEDVERIEAESSQHEVDDEGYELNEDGEIQLLDDEEVEKEVEEGTLLDTEEKEIIESGSKSENENNTETDTDKKDSDEVQDNKENDENKTQEDDEEAKKLRMLQKKEKELEVEVENIVNGLIGFLWPIEALVDREPFVIVQLTEKEAPSVYADMSKNTKEVYLYTFEIFDNGTGMSPEDLEKFGKYLASSKSQKLKQTRGSQGFGSPSAFSDAQNTTGQPITVVSKDANHIYGICSQFYTTSKNNKEYVVPPTEIDCPFSHGTYVKLHYLNVKYRKGYIDSYINMTALTNPHVTIIYLDPQGNEMVFPRRVSRFPRQPTYALPHPSSVNIGDFQDLLRSSTNLSLSAFLQENFVRMSSSLAKKIISEAEKELETILRFLNLKNGYLSLASNTSEKIYLCRTEKRLFGRSKKKRDKLVVYHITDEEALEKYWDLVMPYNQVLTRLTKLEKDEHKLEKKLSDESDKSKKKELKAKIKQTQKEFAAKTKEINEIRKQLDQYIQKLEIKEEWEINDTKITDKMEETVKELTLSKAHPSKLTQKQTEALFKYFRKQKYMKPPTDTAIPIGASILETTMMKEFNLTSSHRSDLFLEYTFDLKQLSAKEKQVLINRLLSKFRRPEFFSNEFSKDNLFLNTEYDKDEYNELIQMYDASHTTDEDFVAANTRPPTSGKGLAFVVEAVVAISPKIPATKQANQALMRYVNRTPKLRDNSDCAIWKATQSVNWKNYKIDTFDNGIPKGNLRVLINVSGPYTHLMFKSQSKNALAEDEILMKEIKYCLEAIGRKIRNFQNKKANREIRRKRSKTIERYIPYFISALLEIAHDFPEYKDLKEEDLKQKLIERLEGKYSDTTKLTKTNISAKASSGNSVKISDQISKKTNSNISTNSTISSTITDRNTTSDVSNISAGSLQAVSSRVIDLDISQKTKTKTKTKTKSKSQVESKSEIESKSIKKSEPPKSAVNSTQKPLTPLKSQNIEKENIENKISKEEIKSKSKSKTSDGPVKSLDELFEKSKRLREEAKKKRALHESSSEKRKSSDVALSNSKVKKRKKSTKSTKSSTKQILIKKEVSKSSTIDKEELLTKSKKTLSIPSKKTLVKPKSKINVITNELILSSFEKEKWYTLRELLGIMKIKNQMDMRHVQMKLKYLVKIGELSTIFKSGKTLWKLKK